MKKTTSLKTKLRSHKQRTAPKKPIINQFLLNELTPKAKEEYLKTGLYPLGW